MLNSRYYDPTVKVCIIVQGWQDKRLQWNAARYGNVTTIVLPANKIWTPPLMLASSRYEIFVSSIPRC